MSSPDARPTTAIIGLGRMGLPIAQRLHRAGFAVTAFDDDPHRMRLAAASGLVITASVAAAAAHADVLITVLPGAPAFEAVMLEAVDVLRPGSLFLDFTSNDPRVAQRVAAESAERAVRGVGAPMAGGPDAAASAGLQFYVGGSAPARDRVAVILDALARPDGVHVAGDDIGSGYAAKLLINLLWFGQVAAVTETLLLGRHLGLEPGDLRGLLAGSAGDSAFAQRHLDRLLDGDYLTDFGLHECVDELDILASLAAEHSSPFDVSATVTRLHHEALAEFGAVPGEMLVAKLLEQRDDVGPDDSTPAAGFGAPSRRLSD